MENNLFQNKYRIPTARAQWHDYNHGIYFVTICTANRAHYFGEIADTQMILSETGRIATENFRNVGAHYPYAEIPLFVVMPNHIHAVVMIDEPISEYVETRRATSLHDMKSMSDIANGRGLLSVVVGGLKSAITKFANENGIDFAWQPRFYDRIVRNTDELNRMAEYINNNVANWQTDKLNKTE